VVTRQVLTKYRLTSVVLWWAECPEVLDALGSPVPGLGLPLGRHVVSLIISEYGSASKAAGQWEPVAPLPSPLWPLRDWVRLSVSSMAQAGVPWPGPTEVSGVQAPRPAFAHLSCLWDRPLIPLLLQTPNSAFPHLCAFAQSAALPPVNPGFFRSPPKCPFLTLAPLGSPSHGAGRIRL